MSEIKFLKCEKDDCDSVSFVVKLSPIGEFGMDHCFICARCGEANGGVISDPLNEVNK